MGRRHSTGKPCSAERVYDVVKAAAIPVEEAGELLKAANDHDEKHTSCQSIVTEAVHTAASAIRFLKNLEEKNHE